MLGIPHRQGGRDVDTMQTLEYDAAASAELLEPIAIEDGGLINHGPPQSCSY